MARRTSSALDRQLASQDLASRHPVAAHLFDAYGPPALPPAPQRSHRFRSIVSSISAQQVSGSAARTIFQRVVDTVGDEFTPDRVIRLGADPLRSAGLSASKARSVLDLAAKCIDRTVRLDSLGSLNDDDVIDMLTSVYGIGVWTAQMVLLFDLRRIDIWPTGDLGVRSGYAKAFGLKEPPTASELDSLGSAFEPYRSIMAWWCWRATEAPDGRRAERQALTPRP